MKQFYGIPYSFTGHANDLFVASDSPVSLGQLVADARLVVTVTDYSADWLRQRYPDAAGKIARVYNGIHPDAFARADFSRVPPEIVSVGRLIEKKGFPDLIAACGLLRDRGVAFVCRIIGAGPLEEPLRARIAESGLQSQVLLEGARPEAEVIGYLRAGRVFALACVHEKEGGADNLPTVIMEAMAAGLPVVSTRVAGVPEMIEDGVNGRLLAEHDVPGLADALESLLTDSGRARAWGNAGRQLVEKKFATANTTRALKELLVSRAGAWPPARASRQDPRILGRALLHRFGIR